MVSTVLAQAKSSSYEVIPISGNTQILRLVPQELDGFYRENPSKKNEWWWFRGTPMTSDTCRWLLPLLQRLQPPLTSSKKTTAGAASRTTSSRAWTFQLEIPPIENMGNINGQNRENHPWIYYKYHGNKGIFWETMVGECWRKKFGYSAVHLGKSRPFPMGSPKYHHLCVGKKTAPILPRKWENTVPHGNKSPPKVLMFFCVSNLKTHHLLGGSSHGS